LPSKLAIITTSDGEAVEYEISKAANDKLINSTVFNKSVINDADGQDTSEDASTNDDTRTIVPSSLKTRDHRGWSPEIISEKKLGWAPRDMDSLRDHLLS